ncbi:AMP-binding protein [Nocardia arizonensis]|uniref:AMP-binding protein n=1 Tax=Nocardia arizonensis TaxID=1141647 RepID=UPI000A5BE6CE|nr:AMP-binding protein [Nocardia arizonensis]
MGVWLMVTEIFETTHDVPVGRRAVWDALVDPHTYVRLFAYIGGCEFLENVDGRAVLMFRIGTPEAGIAAVCVHLITGRPETNLELYCPDLGSLAAIRLRPHEDGTRVTVTVYAPARVHPVVAAAQNADVIDWVRTGLDKVAQRCRAAPTSMLSVSVGTPVRRQVQVARQMISTGIVNPIRPDHGLKQLAALAKWGLSLAGGYATSAACTPDRIAVIDAHGSRTFAEMHRRTDALACALNANGLDAQAAAGVLARNHGGLIEIMAGAGKAGLDLVLLNAGLSARQLEDLAQRERLSALFVDAEFDPLVRYLAHGMRRYGTVDASVPDRETIDDLVASAPKAVPRRRRTGKLVVLTSGTSGRPKGARRPDPKGLDPVAAVLSRIPLRMEETILIASPLFHTWGLGMLQLSTALRATVVLQERFDAEGCLRLIARHRVRTLVVVPTMVQRILDLPDVVRARYDLSSLEVVACGGAPLSSTAVLRFTEVFGEILYNVYGSTEVSWATVATPEDLRTSPGTVGRPPAGTRVAVLGADLRPVPVGTTGRIFVGNHMLFDGYVNARPPVESDGMLDTGDIGYLDVAGRLFIDGRDDEMVISGGEKFFPRPVEEALEYLPQVREAAVVGVPDPDFGQRLAAFVVKREGTGLDSQMVRDYIRHRLGRVAVPRDVSFLAALPRGETGKIIKRFLVAPEHGAPQTS